MNETVKNIGKGMIASAVAVSAVAVGIKSMRKPQKAKKRLQKTASKALDSVGTMMQSVADVIR